MSSTDVRFDNGRFTYRGNLPWSPSALGKDIVLTVLRGAPWTDFGLSADDAVESLRSAGRTGKLCFSVQDDRPVFPWYAQEAARLRARADQLEAVADDIRDSGANDSCDALDGLRPSVAMWIAAGKLRSHAGELYGSGDKRGPLGWRYKLPTVKVGAKSEDYWTISWNAGCKAWQFGNHRLGITKLGRLIALTLLSGKELVHIGNHCVTVNYLIEMVRTTGRFGQFRESGYELNLYAPISAFRNR